MLDDLRRQMHGSTRLSAIRPPSEPDQPHRGGPRDPSVFEVELRELAARYTAEAEQAATAAAECTIWADEVCRQRLAAGGEGDDPPPDPDPDDPPPPPPTRPSRLSIGIGIGLRTKPLW